MSTAFGWVNQHFNMIYKAGDKGWSTQRTKGLVVALILMVLFTAINLAGAKFPVPTATIIVVIWKDGRARSRHRGVVAYLAVQSC